MQHWKLWPGVHFLNFYFIPVSNRVLVQNLVLVGWSGYLSQLNHSSEITTRNAAVESTNVTVRHDTLETRDAMNNGDGHTVFKSGGCQSDHPQNTCVLRRRTVIATTGIRVVDKE